MTGGCLCCAGLPFGVRSHIMGCAVVLGSQVHFDNKHALHGHGVPSASLHSTPSTPEEDEQSETDDES